MGQECCSPLFEHVDEDDGRLLGVGKSAAQKSLVPVAKPTLSECMEGRRECIPYRSFVCM